MAPRFIVATVFLLLFVSTLPAQEAKHNTLTPEEAAQGWILLFDGENPIELLIDGEWEVADGVLVIGGKGPSRVEVKPRLSSHFELRLEYRTEGAKYINVKTAYKKGSFFGRSSGFSSTGLERQSKDKTEWIEIIFNGNYDPKTDRRSIDSKCRAVGEVGFTKQGHGGGLGEQNTIFSFEVPAGSKFFLRNIKLKSDPVEAEPTDPLWLILSGLVALLAILGLFLLIRLRRKSRTTT